MLSELDAVPLNIDNPEPRVVCTILVDVSGSMNYSSSSQGTENETPIHALNRGYSDFREFLRKDELASRRTEVTVIEFDSNSRVAVPLQEGRTLPEHNFTASGLTAMGSAINRALDIIDERKREYKQNGIEYYRPWIVVFSDGAPTDTDVFNSAVQRLNDVTAHKGATVFPIGIGNDADLTTLSRLSLPQRPAVKLAGVKFSAFFEWLSASMSAVSQSQAHGASDTQIEAMTDMVQLADISGWGVV